MNIKTHWDKVYASKPAQSVSWFQPHAARSLDLPHRTGQQRSRARAQPVH